MIYSANNSIIKFFCRWAEKLYIQLIETRVFRQRLSKRLALYKVDSRDQLDLMAVECDVALQCCDSAECQHLIQPYAGFYSCLYRGVSATDKSIPAQRIDLDVGGVKAYSLTLHGIDLDRYENFQQYKSELGKRSSFFLRHAKKALKKGYHVQHFAAANYSNDLVAIRKSMKIRSFGLMLDAWTVNEDQFGGIPSQWVEPSMPSCHQHWEQMLGVFISKPGHKQGELVVNQQLVGYARLHRIGNMLAYKDFMGDGRFVGDGVMKLLHIHILQWILDSGDPHVEGIDNIAHGSIERGSEGIFFWKKKALFSPYRVKMTGQALPEDFDAQQYLELNPDVRISHLNPAQHYIVHGRYEKRVYRRV